jgi:CBS domain-containing protein
MLRQVVSATPDTTAEELVRLMLEHRVSGLPVLREGRVVGVVSDGDLIRRAAAEAVPPRTGWLAFLRPAREQAKDYLNHHGRTARDLMTSPAVTVGPLMKLGEVAALMERKRLKRVPVADEEGRLLGLVTRATLLQALATAPAPAPLRQDDVSLRVAVLEALEAQPWGRSLSDANVMVRDGVVHLWGQVPDARLRRAIAATAGSVPGVKGVADHFDTSV